MRSKRKWSAATTVTLSPRLTPETDEWIWWNYSLMLLINRHVADFMDDDTVSDALQKVRQRIPLPFDN
jgi:hypothetical protein